MTATTELRPEIERLRRAGYSYRDIGNKVGLSHERVRQILVGNDDPSTWALPSAYQARQEQVREITAWLKDNGPVERTRVLEEFDLTSSQLSRLVAEGLPSHMVLGRPRTWTPTVYEDTDIYDALRRAWSAYRAADSGASGLSHATYTRYRAEGDPSASLIVNRHGWNDACIAAGVTPGKRWREGSGYVSRWTDDQLLDAVARFIEHCHVSGDRPSYLGYDRWQQTAVDAPSGTLVRNRLRASEAELRTWNEIVEYALGK